MNMDRILEGRELLMSIPAEDSLAFWRNYYAGAASSDLANLLRERGESGQNRKILDYINHAIDQLEATVEQDPTFADGWALLSTAYVHKIDRKPFRGIVLGRKYNKAMNKAFELAPQNPRVRLLKAIMDYNLPGIVGGDKKRAEDGLNEAILMYANEAIDDPFLPSWGHDQAHARLGIIYMDRGDLEDARKSFERALELNPEFGWVSEVLIPSLEELESAASET